MAGWPGTALAPARRGPPALPAPAARSGAWSSCRRPAIRPSTPLGRRAMAPRPANDALVATGPASPAGDLPPAGQPTPPAGLDTADAPPGPSDISPHPTTAPVRPLPRHRPWCPCMMPQDARICTPSPPSQLLSARRPTALAPQILSRLHGFRSGLQTCNRARASTRPMISVRRATTDADGTAER